MRCRRQQLWVLHVAAVSCCWLAQLCCRPTAALQVTRDIPLNHGCMAPITVRIPKGALVGLCICQLPGAAHHALFTASTPADSTIIHAPQRKPTSTLPLSSPPGCLLSPSPEAAVVGGNVLTSQRVTDVVLKAFNAAAASQVRMGMFHCDVRSSTVRRWFACQKVSARQATTLHLAQPAAGLHPSFPRAA